MKIIIPKGKVMSDIVCLYDQKEYIDCAKFHVGTYHYRMGKYGDKTTFGQKFYCIVNGENLDTYEELVDQLSMGDVVSVEGIPFLSWTPGDTRPPRFNVEVTSLKRF